MAPCGHRVAKYFYLGRIAPWRTVPVTISTWCYTGQSFARALSGAEVVKYLYNVDRPARKNPDLRCGRVGDCNADPAGFWLLPLIDPHRYSGPQIATSKEAIMSKLVWASALLCLATMSVPTVAQQSCEKKCMQRCSESATGGGTAQSDCMSKCMNQQGKCPD